MARPFVLIYEGTTRKLFDVDTHISQNHVFSVRVSQFPVEQNVTLTSTMLRLNLIDSVRYWPLVTSRHEAMKDRSGKLIYGTSLLLLRQPSNLMK